MQIEDEADLKNAVCEALAEVDQHYAPYRDAVEKLEIAEARLAEWYFLYGGYRDAN
jgi:hypothetical protein